MFSESHYLIRRFIRFLALPYCFIALINWKECNISKKQVVKDLLYIFFSLKYFPDNYGPCRLWEKDRKEWVYYYGSTYNSYPRKQLRHEVQPYDYMILFNDKFVCEQLCKSIDILIPESYGIIDSKRNYRLHLRNIFDKINTNEIIIKPLQGHAGRGIHIVKRRDHKILVQTGAHEQDLDSFVMEGQFIAQAMVLQHNTISAISSASVNTIRVVTLFTRSGDVIVVSSSMRFSVGGSYVDNWSSGGIAVGIDHSTGMLKKTAYDKNGNAYTHHPVSGVEFLDFSIPQWDSIIETAVKIQKSFPYYKLLGMDIALSQEGPVLIEINANSDIIFQEQTSGPLLKDSRVLKAFDEYNLLINSYQKKLV